MKLLKFLFNVLTTFIKIITKLDNKCVNIPYYIYYFGIYS